MAEEFVIHVHSGFGPTHFDLMLRRGEALATWQMRQSPLELAPGQSVPARRLGDHRLAYLTYEGAVSGGRGEVARQDKGTYELLADDAEGWRVRLAGGRMRGVYRLRAVEGDDWELLCESAG